MATRVGEWLGMAVAFVTLLMACGVATKTGARTGVKVQLAHVCSHDELNRMGDGREIFVRYRSDQSSFANQTLMPVERDLRQTLRAAMITRAEPSIFFAGDESLSYGEVAGLLAKLQEDSPGLVVFLTTRSQTGPLEPKEAQQGSRLMFCVPQMEGLEARDLPPAVAWR